MIHFNHLISTLFLNLLCCLLSLSNIAKADFDVDLYYSKYDEKTATHYGHIYSKDELIEDVKLPELAIKINFRDPI